MQNTKDLVWNSIQGNNIERIPICYWHHFSEVKNGEQLAELTYDFFVSKNELDILKIMPDLPYPQLKNSIKNEQDLVKLQRLDMNTPAFREQIICIKSLRAKAGDNVPIILTLFSPLSYLIRFMGMKKVINLGRRNPKTIHIAIELIADNLKPLIKKAIGSGADGIYYSCMGATTEDFLYDEYLIFGASIDKYLLNSVSSAWLNIVHIHANPSQAKASIYFKLFDEYPVSVISWSDKVTGPSISEARKLTSKCLMSGLFERGAALNGDKPAIYSEIKQALDQTSRTHFILASGCSYPDNISQISLQTVRNSTYLIN